MRTDERGPEPGGPDRGRGEAGGVEVFGVEWDGSGPAAAGSGRVLRRGARFLAVLPGRVGAAGPYETLAEAVALSGLGQLPPACLAVWYRRGHARLRDLLGALRAEEGQAVEINGAAWRFRAGRWRRLGR